MTDNTSIQSNQERICAEIKLVLERIFVIVGHTKDEAEENAEVTMSKIVVGALEILFSKKSPEERVKIYKEVSAEGGKSKVDVVMENFQPTEVQTAMQASTQNVFTEYFQAIKNSLSPQQIEEVQKLVAQMGVT